MLKPALTTLSLWLSSAPWLWPLDENNTRNILSAKPRITVEGRETGTKMATCSMTDSGDCCKDLNDHHACSINIIILTIVFKGVCLDNVWWSVARRRRDYLHWLTTIYRRIGEDRRTRTRRKFAMNLVEHVTVTEQPKRTLTQAERWASSLHSVPQAGRNVQEHLAHSHIPEHRPGLATVVKELASRWTEGCDDALWLRIVFLAQFLYKSKFSRRQNQRALTVLKVLLYCDPWVAQVTQ